MIVLLCPVLCKRVGHTAAVVGLSDEFGVEAGESTRASTIPAVGVPLYCSVEFD